MSRIKEIRARQISDSRGNPTLEARVYLETGVVGWAAVPSGASTGEREALELRDGDAAVYRGKGVLKAIQNVNTALNFALRRKPVEDQREIDQLMIDLDGTPFKSNLGANATLAVSLAVADAASNESLGEGNLYQYIATLCEKQPAHMLPVPMMNVINGGEHASNKLRIQEFMIAPTGAASLWEALQMGSAVFRALDGLVEGIADNPSVGVGDEGGYSPLLKPGRPQVEKVHEALDLIMKAITAVGLRPGTDVMLALDPAASEFYDVEREAYNFFYPEESEELWLSSDEMVDFYERLTAKYPIYSIEDGLAEKDDEGWVQLTRRLGDRIQIVGDDLFVTNSRIFREGIQNGEANSILIKVNQIGTLKETLETIALAEASNYTCVVSHRSGETLDTKIADISVGCATGQIKTGSMSRGDRIAKYNRLKDIEFALGDAARFPGEGVLRSVTR